MNNSMQWSLYPKIKQHVFWNRKTQFLLHEDVYQNWVVFAVVDGEFHYEIDAESGNATFGDLVLCPPGITFRREIVTPLTFHFLHCSWNGPEGHPISTHKQIPVGKITIRDTHRLTSSYNYLEEISLQNDSPSYRWRNHLLCDIWRLFLMEKKLDAITNLQKRIGDPLMQEVSKYLREQMSKTITMKSLSPQLGLSPVQLTRRFQKAFGTTPIRYLTTLRLQKAQTLLLETNHTLDSIAEQCGYQNGFYLSRVFSRQLNMSPSQYRRTNRI